MPLEPHRILPVVQVLAAVRTSDNIAALATLAAANSELRLLCLPYLFSHVRWPHPNKHDEESGLHFFPETLWPLFKRVPALRFDLIWPDDWPDASPPRWGDRYYVGGDYHPRHTDKLATALPRMPGLISFSICCPFFPPNSLFNALLTCTSVRELRMTDTPLYISMIPKSPPEFVIERLYLIPVAEAPRVGQSPYHSRYSSPDLYYSREYRKKYKNDILARYAASAFLFDVGKPTSLTQVQVSGDLCTLDEFYQHEWPRLVSLVMTGHPPRQTGTELVDVISKMRELKELRLLFAKSVTRGDSMFKVLPAAPEYTSAKGNHGSLLEQIESLAVSDACNLDRVGYFLKGVERLAVLAISDIAEPTSAFSKRTMQRILREIVHKNHTLKHLRIMLEENVEPDICKVLADRFPKLEVLEVEKCGYHDGRDAPTWSEYVENLKPIRRTLKNLRLGMQFELLGPALDSAHAWRIQRQNCAQYFAAKLGQLTRVGFEYRRRPGPHRFDDRWLDWDIDRRRFTPQMTTEWEIRREAKLARPSWYPFPEVWKPRTLYEEEEIADSGGDGGDTSSSM
ncbi:hypothetical protein AGABI2DRAFT_210991 [Agaricus bisporus var. bisporus H97]|uniref:hypothetical protein n=1 Tax=Agaricus bisporus var. bisporus (strain H97 / ATCC MYA-4626 / FGSC 10389) TaxID=936046 RepID=UPI00029F7DAC|nr:hypothetical protein AGABI2DRAFT_210991 [Agaricus bisporus var. bisporus H97]EKV43177.1 hypothetical protein AGABI2DRAFT_210991 [Agaricus bisporus var. bisporus H97]